MSALAAILLATTAAGLLSMLVGSVVLKLPQRWRTGMVAFAAGVMLSSALLDLLPEALSASWSATPNARDSHFSTRALTSLPATLPQPATPPHRHAAHPLFVVLLGGLLGFFLLERLLLAGHRHGHEHEHGQANAPSSQGLSLILVGDALHNFVDGLLIAAAFLANPALGVAATLAVIAHELPQEMGDFILLTQAGWSAKRALALNALTSLASIAGGILGYLALSQASRWNPYILTLSAASFLYIALTHLLPLLQRQAFWRQALPLMLGVAAVPFSGGMFWGGAGG